MFSALDLPIFRQRVSKLSVEEYHQLGEFNKNHKRTELIRGIVIEKMSKPPLHCTSASLLERTLNRQLPPGFCLRREDPLTLRDSEPEPDIAIVAGTHRDYIHAHPSTAFLVAEVAVTTFAADRAMAELYAEARVPEYWIVLPQEGLVEVHLHPEGSRYREMRTFTRAEEIVSQSVPGLRLALGELFAGLP